MCGRITVPSIVIIVNGVIGVIYVGWRRYANCLATLDGLVCPGNAQHQACCRPNSTGILSLVKLVSPQALRWCLYPQCAGVIAPVMLASASLQCRSQHVVFTELASLPVLHWHPCQLCNGTLASVALVLLPLLCRRHCQDCAGIFALHVLAPLPLLCWRHCPSCAGFCPLAMMLATHHHRLAGIFSGAALASLQVSRWRCHHCSTGVVTLVALAFLPLRWRHCQHCPGVFTLALASLPSLHWHLPN
jgi:hypothetical protein